MASTAADKLANNVGNKCNSHFPAQGNLHVKFKETLLLCSRTLATFANGDFVEKKPMLIDQWAKLFSPCYQLNAFQKKRLAIFEPELINCLFVF